MDQSSPTCSGAPPSSSTRFCAGRTRRHPGRAADQVRSRHQSHHRQGARADDPGIIPAASRRGDRMKRRAFITLLGGAAAAWPLAARAQQALPVIGYFSGRSPDAEAPIRVPFLKALEASGFTDGRNVAIEYRFAEGQDERLPALAAELVRRPVTMLVATDRPSALAAKAATATLPIVFASGADPVQQGLVASFNR